MNTLLPRPEDRGQRLDSSQAAAPVQSTPRPFRFALAASHTTAAPGYYLMLLRQRYANDARVRFQRVSTTQS